MRMNKDEILEEMDKLGVNRRHYHIIWDLDVDVKDPHIIFSYPIYMLKELRKTGCDSVLEIGTARGKTTTFLALGGCRLVTIDVDVMRGKYAEFAAQLLRIKDKITFITARSNPLLSYFKDNSFDAVFVDGDHKYEAAYWDIKEAVRIARKLVLVHDVDHPTPGVLPAFNKAIEEQNLKSTIIPTEKAACGLGVIYK